MRYVPGSGNPSAKLMLVGEAPGGHEELEGVPFVGPAGKIVDEVLEKAGVDRSEVYVTNVVKIRPPDNKIHRLPELGTKIEDFLPQLWKEVEEINPNCILAFGNVALKALTGETGINDFRGSILPNVHNGLPKVVASIHPASLFHETQGKMRSYRDKAFIQFDVNRAVEQSLFRELRRPSRTLHIARNSLDLIRFLDRNIGRGLRTIAYDIETFKAIPMCIGFAFSKYEAISVPLFNLMSDRNTEGIALHDMAIIWKIIADLLLDPQYKLIGHNLKFDQGRLEELGLPTAWPYFDTQLGFHVMYPELPKRLAFVASVLTEEPYYKDELEEYNPKKDKLEKRLLYNAKDCAVEFEVYEREVAELTEMGMLDWYFEKQHKLHKFYYNMEKRGFAIDQVERRRLTKKYDRYIRWIDKSLERDLGYELNVNSPKRVMATLYGDLKCPIRKDTKEETLQMLMLNAVKDDRRKRIINNILKGRKAKKTKSTYIAAKLHCDDRMHTVFNITGTESGRTSTSKPSAPVVAEPEGIALQTLTKHGDVGADIRKMYIPTPRHILPAGPLIVSGLLSKKRVLIEADLAQAEDRVVCNLAHDHEGLAVLNRKDFKRNKFGIKDDRHTLTAIMVTGAAFEAVTDEIRQLGKKTRHAGNYKMGKRRLSLLAGISEWRAGKCLERFHADNPKIEHVFWEEVIQALRDNGQKLASPQGRVRLFFDKWGDDMFKEAFSFIPQATVSDHLKFSAVKIEERAPWIEMLAEAHDSFTAEIDEDRIEEACGIIKEELEVPIDFSRCSLPRDPIVIPCEIQVGYENWKEMKRVA